MTALIDVPTLLAVLAAALCAVAIFAPARSTATPAPAPVSFAPPCTAEPPVERWSPPPFEDEPFVMDDADAETIAEPPAVPEPATWPLLIDARAFACDAQARHDLVDALAALRAPWADAILERARVEEPDDGVRAALQRVLSRA